MRLRVLPYYMIDLSTGITYKNEVMNSESNVHMFFLIIFYFSIKKDCCHQFNDIYVQHTFIIVIVMRQHDCLYLKLITEIYN